MTRAALVSCARSIRAADAAVRASEVGVQHWRSHAQAYRDFMADRMSRTQAEAVWSSTQRAGALDGPRWTTAVDAYDRTADACAGTGTAPSGQPLADAAESCADRAAAAERVVAAGRTVMNQWTKHLGEAEMRADGLMPDVAADARFAAAVRTSVVHLADFAGERERLKAAPACRVPTA